MTTGEGEAIEGEATRCCVSNDGAKRGCLRGTTAKAKRMAERRDEARRGGRVGAARRVEMVKREKSGGRIPD